jgi:hypothetical protein
MRPPRSILDPKFKYRSAANTDVRKTFEAHRRLQRMQERAQAHTGTVTPFIKRIAHG